MKNPFGTKGALLYSPDGSMCALRGRQPGQPNVRAVLRHFVPNKGMPPLRRLRVYFYKEDKLPMKEIPIWEKSNLSLEEAAAYSGIGINKLREITNEDRCKFVLWVGNKRLIKRRLFDQFIEQAYSI